MSLSFTNRTASVCMKQYIFRESGERLPPSGRTQIRIVGATLSQRPNPTVHRGGHSWFHERRVSKLDEFIPWTPCVTYSLA